MISLIHPSRGRPEKSVGNVLEWENKAGKPVEVIVSLDADDKTLDKYIDLHAKLTDLEWLNASNHNVFNGGRGNGLIFSSVNASVVEATNKAAAKASGDILIYLSDDFKCFPDWGKTIESFFGVFPEDMPIVLKVDDCLQPFDVRVLTIPIMNREAYQRLGYFFHPGYKSMFCDQHLYERAKRLGFLKFAPYIKFEHCHVSVGKAENDETYKRSAANWEQGKALFAKHKAAGFIE